MARYNIQVNGIGPGYFATAQTAPIRTEGHPFNEFIIKRTPAMRWGCLKIWADRLCSLLHALPIS